MVVRQPRNTGPVDACEGEQRAVGNRDEEPPEEGDALEADYQQDEYQKEGYSDGKDQVGFDAGGVGDAADGFAVIEDFGVGMLPFELLHAVAHQAAQIGRRTAVECLEGGGEIGYRHRTVGAEEVSVYDVVASGNLKRHVAQHSFPQIERVIADGLGGIAGKVVHHDVGVLQHLAAYRCRFDSRRKGGVGRGIDEGGDMAKHEIQRVQRGFGLEAAEDVVDILAASVLGLQQFHEFVGAGGQFVGREPVAGRCHLDVNLILEPDGAEGKLALDTGGREKLGDVFFVFHTQPEHGKQNRRGCENYV